MSVTTDRTSAHTIRDKNGSGGRTSGDQTEEQDLGPDIVDDHGVELFDGPSTTEQRVLGRHFG
jgi:hypothetical protein